jgi:hypothetical protein
MTGRSARKERAEALRATLLRDAQVDECWQPVDQAHFVDVAVRRWTSSDRRIKPSQRSPENRIQDLVRGFREAEGEDLIYAEPGWFEHLGERYGTALLAAEQDI